MAGEHQPQRQRGVWTPFAGAAAFVLGAERAAAAMRDLLEAMRPLAALLLSASPTATFKVRRTGIQARERVRAPG